MLLQMSSSPTSHSPWPCNSCALEYSMLSEPIHFRFIDSLFPCYSYTQYLINHIHNSCKSYFLLINIGPGKLHRLRSVILFQNNSWSCLESSKLGFSITKTTIMHSKIKKKTTFIIGTRISKKRKKGTFGASLMLTTLDFLKKSIVKNLHFNRKPSII